MSGIKSICSKANKSNSEKIDFQFSRTGTTTISSGHKPKSGQISDLIYLIMDEDPVNRNKVKLLLLPALQSMMSLSSRVKVLMAEEGGEMEDQGDLRVKSREESIILKTMITEEEGIIMIMEDMMADTEMVAIMMNSTTMMTPTITDHYHMTDQEEQDLCTEQEVCHRGTS